MAADNVGHRPGMSADTTWAARAQRPATGQQSNISPDSYQIERVTRLLKKASYLSMLSVHDVRRPNRPISSPRRPDSLIGIDVNEELHRFECQSNEPTLANGLRARSAVAEAIARVQIRWMVIPDQFVAAPGLVPPPTELDPTQSQRFTMLDGRMTFKDRSQSRFHAFGTGRTFPIIVNGRPELRIGAVVNVLEGFGKLKGLPGTITVNGYITPPNDLFLVLIARFVDPTERLRARASLSTPITVPNPDPNTTCVILQGEMDPERPVTLNRAGDGRVVGSNLNELLRLTHIECDTNKGNGIRSTTHEGPIVGRLSTTTYFDPFSRASPIPLYTQNGVFTLFDRQRQTVGTLRANVVEGRVFSTKVAGATNPFLRIAGFGPFLGGTGQFAGAAGMMSMNSAISLNPLTLSMQYVLRIIDPDGHFRVACRDAWL